jgi:hypothetical protein
VTDSEGGATVGHDNSSRSTTMKPMTLIVKCHSRRKSDKRPVRFWLGGRQYQVESVFDQGYDRESVFYKVRADDGNVHILRQQTSMSNGARDLVSFSAERRGTMTHRKAASAASMELRFEHP